MNKRIQELAEQNGFIHEFMTAGEKTDALKRFEKFTELIVQECVNQVKEQYTPVIEDEIMMKDTHWDGYVQCGVDSVVAIREHFFGVEE